MATGPVVGDGWLHGAAAALGGAVVDRGPTAGLIEDLSALDGPGFLAADRHPHVRDFYEHTAGWRMEVWTQWTAVFQPGADRPSVHVTFPLERGNVQVFLRPSARPDGSLVLSSPAGRFGADGAYPAVRLHYRLERRTAS